MTTFPLDSSGYTAGHGWRPLRKKDPLQRGWDVYDLQCKLNYVKATPDGLLATDGVFGNGTKHAVQTFQAQVAPVAGALDGIAGAQTQVVLGQNVAKASPHPDRVKGQMQRETSMLCGIYTAMYANGSQDTGPIQRNTQYNPDLPNNFDAAPSIGKLIAQIDSYHKKYVGWGITDKRAWEAAQGSWNSPVFADRYARGQAVPQSFLDYIDAVTAFV